jgi:hypothetical protein
MTTTSEAIKIMQIVAACHHRTAPRLDDREATLITANIWAELFSAHNLEYPDLEAAVKKRAAAGATDAPEPAEIITTARAIRRDRDERTGPTTNYETTCELKGTDTQELAKARLQAIITPIAQAKSIPHA